MTEPLSSPWQASCSYLDIQIVLCQSGSGTPSAHVNRQGMPDNDHIDKDISHFCRSKKDEKTVILNEGIVVFYPKCINRCAKSRRAKARVRGKAVVKMLMARLDLFASHPVLASW